MFTSSEVHKSHPYVSVVRMLMKKVFDPNYNIVSHISTYGCVMESESRRQNLFYILHN